MESRHVDVAPRRQSARFGIEAGYRDSYQWYRNEGRALYEFDFSRDDALLAELEGRS